MSLLKSFGLLSLLLLIAKHTVTADVIELTDDNFDELVRDGVWMIDVYAPW